MRGVLISLAAALTLNAQSDSMAASIDKQKASVRQQMKQVHGDNGSFFSRPWPMPELPQTAIVAPPADASKSDPPNSVESPPVASAPKLANPVDCDPIEKGAVDQIIQQASTRYSLKDDLLRAVIQRESAFKPCAVSPKGAMGLMQLMPATARELDVADAFDPQQNIEAGARYLKQLLDRYKGDTSKALAAYNAGSANVDRAGGIPPFTETQNYVSTIMSKLPVF